MRMLQNMGWKYGQALGKNKEGYVAPITFDVKVGRSGLSTAEEAPSTPMANYYSKKMPKKRLQPVGNIDGMYQ